MGCHWRLDKILPTAIVKLKIRASNFNRGLSSFFRKRAFANAVVNVQNHNCLKHHRLEIGEVELVDGRSVTEFGCTLIVGLLKLQPLLYVISPNYHYPNFRWKFGGL
jgi:hypothetical protein